MTQRELALYNADGELAGIVTITGMGATGEKIIIDAAERGIRSELSDEQVSDR